MTMPSNTDIAWAAGFYDGEGTAGCYPNKDKISGRTYHKITMSVSQCDTGVLVKFLSAVNVGNIYGPFHTKNPKRSNLWQWRVTNLEDIQQAYDLLEPYIGTIKKAQLLKAMQDFDNRPNKRESVDSEFTASDFESFKTAITKWKESLMPASIVPIRKVS